MKSLLVLVLGIFLLIPPLSWAEQNSAKKSDRRERVHQLIMMRLSSGLNLNPSQTQQLSEILKSYRQKKMESKRQLWKLKAELRKETPEGNEKKIQETLAKIQQREGQIDRGKEEMFAEVKKMLSPQQQAQFVLIMDEIRHEVRAVRRRRPRDGGPSYQGLTKPGYLPGYQYPASPPNSTAGDNGVKSQ